MGLMKRLTRKKKTTCCAQQKFLTALHGENVTQVQNLLINHRDEIEMNTLNEQGISALHMCALANNTIMLRVLINFEADLNARDVNGWTSLHAAAALGYTDIIKVLLRNGIDYTMQSLSGQRAIEVAKSRDTKYVIKKYSKLFRISQNSFDSSMRSSPRSSTCSSVSDFESTHAT